jgi:hypothetical protein
MTMQLEQTIMDHPRCDIQPTTLILHARHNQHLNNLRYNRNLAGCICIGLLVTSQEIVVRVYFNFSIIRFLISLLAAPYPIYSHSNSYTSVHSASSSSIYPSSASGNQRPPMAPRTSSATSVAQSVLGHHRPPMPSRTSSATSVTPSEPKPVLKHTKGWIGHSTYGPRKPVPFSFSCDGYVDSSSTYVRSSRIFHESETTCDSEYASTPSIWPAPPSTHLL